MTATMENPVLSRRGRPERGDGAGGLLTFAVPSDHDLAFFGATVIKSRRRWFTIGVGIIVFTLMTSVKGRRILTQPGKEAMNDDSSCETGRQALSACGGAPPVFRPAMATASITLLPTSNTTRFSTSRGVLSALVEETSRLSTEERMEGLNWVTGFSADSFGFMRCGYPRGFRNQGL